MSDCVMEWEISEIRWIISVFEHNFIRCQIKGVIETNANDLLVFNLRSHVYVFQTSQLIVNRKRKKWGKKKQIRQADKVQRTQVTIFLISLWYGDNPISILLSSQLNTLVAKPCVINILFIYLVLTTMAQWIHGKRLNISQTYCRRYAI